MQCPVRSASGESPDEILWDAIKQGAKVGIGGALIAKGGEVPQ